MIFYSKKIKIFKEKFDGKSVDNIYLQDTLSNITSIIPAK